LSVPTILYRIVIFCSRIVMLLLDSTLYKYEEYPERNSFFSLPRIHNLFFSFPVVRVVCNPNYFVGWRLESLLLGQDQTSQRSDFMYTQTLCNYKSTKAINYLLIGTAPISMGMRLCTWKEHVLQRRRLSISLLGKSIFLQSSI